MPDIDLFSLIIPNNPVHSQTISNSTGLMGIITLARGVTRCLDYAPARHDGKHCIPLCMGAHHETRTDSIAGQTRISAS